MEVNRDANVPLYKQVYDLVKKDIIDRKYKSGELLPPERDLSNQFGVDRITVRRSLEMLVRDGLVEKIAGLGTRVKEFPNEDSSGGNSKNILFVLPKSQNSIDRITEPFNASLFYRIERECQKKGYCLIYTTLSEEDELSRRLNGNNFSGIIFVSNINEKFYTEARMLGIPSVMVNNKSELFISIMADNEKGAYEVVKHLTDSGHKRIGMIMGKQGYTTSQERFDGYKRALMDAGIDWQRQVIRDGDWTFDGGYNAMKEILQQEGQLPTAIFAANDIAAFGAFEAIRETGMSIPDDISVVGFDDIEQCKFIHPQLTTVKVDTDILGMAACQYLFNTLETGQMLNIKIIIPTTVIVRNSTSKI